jgi:uncharacterized protein YjdB
MKLKLNKNGVKRGFILFALGFLFTVSAFGQLPTAPQVASQMKVGWNLGNTLEAICSETAWSNPTTTQTLINSVKAAGFNTVRIPCAWDCHTTNGVIDPAWIARVKEVVDYCINNDMYVILNIHWDGGWLDNNITRQKQSTVIAKQTNYWTQIANYFIAYDEHLIFAGSNEPPVDDAAGMEILLSYHQAFIDAVRATGGNNSSRTLIVQGPSTDIEKTNNLMNTMPTDQIANRLMVEVHYYTPYQFCLMEADATWGSMSYYWGNGYHSTTETSRNATWGEESDIEYYFGLMKTKFVDNGIPVILGEYAAMKRTTPADLPLHLASRAYFHKYIVSSAIAKGIIPYYWDHGQSAFALFNRSTGIVVDQQNLNAIMEGAGGGSTTVSVTGVSVSPTTVSISIGGTSQLTATVAPSNATNKTVSWSSNNTSVAAVSTSGLVTGVAAGSATITVTTQDGGKTASSSITVSSGSVAVTGVSVSPSTASISVGGTSQLTATVVPSNATNKAVSWNSSNTSVASISSTGLVTGLAAGSAIITVTTQDGSFTATCNVTVTTFNDYTIVVRASGNSGKEKIQLIVGGTIVNSWTLKRSMADYSTTTSLSGEIRVEFFNDANRNDARIDYIVVNGTTFQAEDQPENTGVYVNNQCGGSYSEWLNCNGYILFSATTLKSDSGATDINHSNYSNDVLVYPNPASDFIKIKLSNNIEVASISIYNISGMQVGNFIHPLSEETNEISIDFRNLNLKNGIYLLELTSENNRYINKLIIQK